MARNGSRKIVMTEEMFSRLKEEVYRELENKLEYAIDECVVRRMSEKMGMILDFPLTVKQVASLTGRHEQNIYKMCERGKIPFVKIGSSIHINLRDLNSTLIKL